MSLASASTQAGSNGRKHLHVGLLCWLFQSPLSIKLVCMVLLSSFLNPSCAVLLRFSFGGIMRKLQLSIPFPIPAVYLS
jgi:hypothetical protein